MGIKKERRKMSVGFKFVNFDNLYNSVNGGRIILNNLHITSDSFKERIDKYIYKNYTDDNISLLPSCQCGEVVGEYHLGKRCGTCGTLVKSDIESSVSFLIWAKQVSEVEKFISPIAIHILLRRYKVTSPSTPLLRYVIDTSFRLDPKMKKSSRNEVERFLNILAVNNIELGYNSFVKNFYTIIDILETEFKKSKKSVRLAWLDFLKENEHLIFSEYLPFPNNNLMLVDSNALGRFIDKNIMLPLDGIRRLTGIDISGHSSKSKQNKVAKTIIDLSDFYDRYTSSAVFPKPGLIRQHISSTKAHFTARAVITSIVGNHSYDEIYLPWTVAVGLFRPFILKGLYKVGMSYREAVNHIENYTRIYSDVIDNIFKEMLVSSAGGIDALLNRNPSLHRGSLQQVRITRFKTDPKDKTISMSYLIAKAFNADFDGDALNLSLILTKDVKDNLENFAPHHSLLALSGVNDFSGNIAFPKTVVSNLANWYNN